MEVQPRLEHSEIAPPAYESVARGVASDMKVSDMKVKDMGSVSSLNLGTEEKGMSSDIFLGCKHSRLGL